MYNFSNTKVSKNPAVVYACVLCIFIYLSNPSPIYSGIQYSCKNQCRHWFYIYLRSPSSVYPCWKGLHTFFFCYFPYDLEAEITLDLLIFQFLIFFFPNRVTELDGVMTGTIDEVPLLVVGILAVWIVKKVEGKFSQYPFLILIILANFQ